MKSEFIDKTASFVMTAFAFVAGLAWNEAVKAMLAEFNLTRFGPLVYAVIVTIIAVLVSVWLSRLAKKAKKIKIPKKLKSTAKRFDIFA